MDGLYFWDFSPFHVAGTVITVTVPGFSPFLQILIQMFHTLYYNIAETVIILSVSTNPSEGRYS